MSRIYKTIFIDWNGTLSSSKFWWHLEKSKNKEDRIFFEKVEKSLFGNLRELLKPWMLGELKSEDVISRVAKNSTLNYDKIFKEFVNSSQSMELISKDLLKIISKLRNKGAKVVIATDNMDSFTRWTYPGLKLFNHFDGFLNSHDLGAMKGHKDKNGKSLFFNEYLVSTGLKPKDSVLIDDSEDKDKIISSFGIDYLRIEPGISLASTLKGLLSNYR